jgi:hypothetical protein
MLPWWGLVASTDARGGSSTPAFSSPLFPAGFSMGAITNKVAIGSAAIR